jgi:hypothetical protein
MTTVTGNQPSTEMPTMKHTKLAKPPSKDQWHQEKPIRLAIVDSTSILKKALISPFLLPFGKHVLSAKQCV